MARDLLRLREGESRNAVVALKRQALGLDGHNTTRKQERRGGIETYVT